MALGLGMTPDEWQQLRGQVDDGFWGLRTIGLFVYPPQVHSYNRIYTLPGYPPLPTDHDGFSCGAHR